MKKLRWIYTVLLIVGVSLLTGSALFNLDKKSDSFDVEQTDANGNDSEEQESKRSFDDEIIINALALPTLPHFWVRTMLPNLPEALPLVSLALHCPPPNYA